MIHKLFKPYIDEMFPLDPFLKEKIKQLGEDNGKTDCESLLLGNTVGDDFEKKLRELNSGPDWVRKNNSFNN